MILRRHSSEESVQQLSRCLACIAPTYGVEHAGLRRAPQNYICDVACSFQRVCAQMLSNPPLDTFDFLTTLAVIRPYEDILTLEGKGFTGMCGSKKLKARNPSLYNRVFLYAHKNLPADGQLPGVASSPLFRDG